MNYCALCKSNKWCGRPCAKAPVFISPVVQAVLHSALRKSVTVVAKGRKVKRKGKK